MEITEVRKVRQDEVEFTSRFGGSFHNAIFKASVNELRSLFGEENVGASFDEKTKHEWFMLMRNSKVIFYFHIYDYKEYRNYDNNEIIDWHIGSHYGKNEDEQFAKILTKMLNDQFKKVITKILMN